MQEEKPNLYLKKWKWENMKELFYEVCSLNLPQDTWETDTN